MYLNVSFVHIFSFCFHLVSSYNLPNDYSSMFYLEGNQLINEAVQLYRDTFCAENSEKDLMRITICTDVIQSLRNKEEVEYKDAYVDYFMFHNNAKCSDVQIWIPDWNIKTIQPVMICHIRPSIIPMDTHSESFQFYRNIAIFPKGRRKMMIFNLNRQTNVYMFSEIVDLIHWIEFRYNVPPEVFQISVPRSYSEYNNLYNQLREKVNYLYETSVNPRNILNASDPKTFHKICKILYRTEKYDNIVLDKHVRKSNPKKKLVIVLSEDPQNKISFFISLYKCYGQIRTPANELIPSSGQHGIAAGPEENSVILLQEISYKFVVIEYIENLQLTYVEYYEYY